MSFPRHPLVVGALWLPAALYGLLVRLRNRRYDRPGAARRCGVPVISVGNLTVGGTGKTPLVALLAELLRDEGRRPAVVSRGYGGIAGAGPLLVSEGVGPLCEAKACGDEPWQLARALRGVHVLVGSDRVAVARDAVRRGADTILLDDGFQHRRLARELDIVLIDARDPFGNGRLLPAGPLREPRSGLGRAHLVLATRSRPGEDLAELRRTVRRHNPEAPVLGAGHRVEGFVDAAGREQPPPERAVAFCGIGNPERFRADLIAQGVELAGFRAFADHHRFRESEIRELGRRAERDNARLVTTEKDLARIPEPLLRAVRPVPHAMRIRAEVHDLSRLREVLASATRGAAS